MNVSPEERRKIYEEKKSLIENSQSLQPTESEFGSSTVEKLTPNIAGLLCYIGTWISGIIFLVLEEKNEFVRFHAAQSIVVFGTLNFISIILGWIPRVGGVATGLSVAVGFIFWVVLMVKAYQGETYKLPVIGSLAEELAWRTRPNRSMSREMDNGPRHAASGTGRDDKGLLGNQNSTKMGRVTISAFTIAWSIVLLVFFNYFYRYVAYYNGDTIQGNTTWTQYSLFTEDIHRWLPILTITLGLTILFHVVMIIFDKYILRETATIILEGLAFATTVSLLSIFPFDFSVIPDSTAADMAGLGMAVVLIGISFGFGVGLLARAIKLIVRLATGKASY